MLSGGELKKETRNRCSCEALVGTLSCRGRDTHRWKLGNDDSYGSHAVDDEIGAVVVGVMCADEEQRNGDEEQEFLRGGVLVAVVDLLPHVEVVVCARIEVKGHAAHVVEHEIGPGRVREVDKRPGRLLRHAWDDVKEDLADEDQHEVDYPCACAVVSAAFFVD